ncbi:MAG: NAD(P)(+) transhydrogenase (Re/Si-specific) subunit beta [Candidatus Endonucleobacter bathymodioli]|uniref:proton-translocating NAD(P)(+) transhydrogenase n=1 Tax=Candidatus Endonucleibacter bathymodioli TaxID=539814 RepID=A0AA90NUG2_9GAMM|nr:NAD(P)(+) transhydrogenase (Re/Si-specific) subunit beta [Candidatus Endonucleobacter bathymodioli]
MLLVLAIGQADIPMFNAYVGLSTATMGLMLGNNILIMSGAIMYSSGASLSYIICIAINHSFISVILGGFGYDRGVPIKENIVLVIGDNDIINISAADYHSSPIAGIPRLKVWNAKDVIVFKRSMPTGHARTQNPLFFG